MKIKFNWGTGIFIVILIFFGSIALRIYISYRHELNLVSEDYYPKGIKYQEQIDKEKNTSKLHEKPTIELNGEVLMLRFPEFFKSKKMEGNIHIYRPSDYKLDEHHVLKLDTSLIQTIDASNFKYGKYNIKVDWNSEGVAYFLEKNIFVSY